MMNSILCLDIGNTHVYGGLFSLNNLLFRFRYPTKLQCTSDTFGIFLIDILRENGYDKNQISNVCLASVVPTIEYSIISACRKYLKIEPMILQHDKAGFELDIDNPEELGHDRIAVCIGAISKYYKNDCNLMICDFGTATTINIITNEKKYVGGSIMPGIKIAMESLSSNTSKLSDVEIVEIASSLGKNTTSQIQIGLYASQIGAIKEILNRLKSEITVKSSTKIIATGGYSHLFRNETIFDVIDSDLVLDGLVFYYYLNSRELNK